MREGGNLEKLIDQQLKLALGVEDSANLRSFGTAAQRLTLVFKMYKQDICYQRMFSENANKELAKQMTKYIQLEQKLERIIAERKGDLEERAGYREGRIEESANRQKFRADRLQWEVTCLVEKNKQLQIQLQQIKEKLEQELLVRVQRISELQGQLQSTNDQVQSLRKNQFSYKEEVEQLKKVISELQVSNARNHNIYQQEFLRQFQRLEFDAQQRQSQMRDNQKQNLHAQVNKLNSQIKTIVDTVNQILQINMSGSININEWLQQLKKASKKYHNEVNKVLNKAQRKQDDPLYEYAQLQKERITAKRMYLLKAVLEQN